MSKVETIEIPMKVHSRNQIDKMHWSRKQKLRKDYQVFIRQQMSKSRIQEATPKECFSINIDVYRSRLIADRDNLIGGCKQLLDAMTHEGFIWDDSSEYISTLKINQYRVKEGKERWDSLAKDLGYPGAKYPGTDFIRVKRKSHKPGLPTLAEVLEEQGRKKSWLAEQMACENSTITRWLQTNEIPLIKRKRIEEVLGVKIKENK